MDCAFRTSVKSSARWHLVAFIAALSTLVAHMSDLPVRIVIHRRRKSNTGPTGEPCVVIELPAPSLKPYSADPS